MSDQEIFINNNPPTALEKLDTLHIVCDRFSHSIRTHLGVALGLVEDIKLGYDISKQDLEDANSSLRSILGVLNSVKDLSAAPEFRPTKVLLSEILAETISQLNYSVCSSISKSSDSRMLDKSLIQKALRSIFLFANSRIDRTSDETRKIYCQLENNGAQQKLSIVFHQSPASDKKTLEGVTSWYELAKVDHRSDSLGLFYASEIFDIHQLNTGCFIENGKITLEASI